MAVTPTDVAHARRMRVGRERAAALKQAEYDAQRIMRSMGRFGLPADYTIAGNARVSVTAVTKSGRPSQSRLARELRKYAR